MKYFTHWGREGVEEMKSGLFWRREGVLEMRCHFGCVAYVILAAETDVVILHVVLCDLWSGSLESVLI